MDDEDQSINLNGYKPFREIAKTSSSQVFISKSPMNKFCCLKLIKRPNNSLSEAQFFASEANALTILNHKSIVPTRDFFYNDKYYGLVTEIKKDGSLQRLLEKRHSLTNEEVQTILYSITTAIQYCHVRNVAHRNIKPTNILIEQDKFFIADFGIRQVDVTSHTYNTSIPYRAPELLDQITPEVSEDQDDSNPESNDQGDSKKLTSDQGSSKILDTPEAATAIAEAARAAVAEQIAAINTAVKSDKTRIDEKPADIWSLGVIAFEMMTGKLPWTATQPTELLQQIKRGVFTFPPQVQPLARDLISKMLTTSPQLRISSHEVLAHPWLSKIKKTNLRAQTGKSVFNTAFNHQSSGSKNLNIKSASKRVIQGRQNLR
ncbi:hypothetical protein M9Y10_039170 [Tritrichomonas musculus]|uniref:Protein kinase domain-containing protein n=1 Tax=Tritrichomonas musculus TaxID=1915356 RepID=A0ABR2KAJ4_9EUKA